MKRPLWFMSKLNITDPKSWRISSNIHLDMGCGINPRNPFAAEKVYGVDILSNLENKTKGFSYLQVMPGERIPLNDSSLDSLSGFDFLEHLPRGATLESNFFILFMNEAHRVLQKGGILLLVTPAFPSPASFQDPTHVNFISEGTINYFIGNFPPARILGYGFTGNFKLLKQEWVGPFSKIWSAPEKSEIFHKSYPLEIIHELKKIISKPQRIRSIIAAIRNPTHLIWLLEKS